MKKRMVATFSILFMVFAGSNPSAEALAENEREEHIFLLESDYTDIAASENVEFVTLEDAVMDGGIFGNNLNWQLTQGGHIHIAGSGPMPDYNDPSETPWYSNADKIVLLTMDDSITAVGQFAFSRTGNLQTVRLSSNLITIGDHAFSWCVALTEAVIPSNVKSIGRCAFLSCLNLADIGILKNVSSIGGSAFYGTPKLKEFYFAGDAPDIQAGSTNEHSFDNAESDWGGVDTLYYLSGAEGWTDNLYYDALNQSLSDYPIAAWGTTDGEFCLGEKDGTYTVFNPGPDADSRNIAVIAAAYDENGKFLDMENVDIKGTWSELPISPGIGASTVKLFILDGDYTPLKATLQIPPLEPEQALNTKKLRLSAGGWTNAISYKGTAKLGKDTNSNVLVIENTEPDSASFQRSIPIKAHTSYRLSAMIRMENYARGEEFPGGATVGIQEMPLLNDFVTSSQWTKSEIVFNSGDMESVTVRASNGGYAATISGTAYFKSIVLEELGGENVEKVDTAQYQTVVKQGQYLLAISTVTDELSAEEGSFSLTKANEYSGEPVPLRSVESISRTIPTPENILSIHSKPLLTYSAGVDLYHVGERKTFADHDRIQITGTPYVEMECLAIGTYCTVWGGISDPASVKITKELAVQLAADYDEAMTQMLPIYGAWLDVDGDGRVALLCGGIHEEEGLLGGGYTNPVNLFDQNGGAMINGFYYQIYSPDEDTTPYLLGMDCVHIGTEGLLPERLLAVALHETAHLMDFSYCVSDNGNVNAWANFLVEGIGDTAPSVIESLDFLAKNTVDWINHPDHNMSLGLLISDDVRVHYAEASLFMQYLRTRYAQMTGSGTGEELYSLVLLAQTKTQGCVLEVMAEEIFGVSGSQLVEDFWTAVYLKESQGRYGFHGESWANEIRCGYTVDGPTNGIMNGGAKCYYMADGDYVVSDANNLTFVVLDRVS